MRVLKKITFIVSLCLLLSFAVSDAAYASDTGHVTVSYISQYEEPQVIEAGTPVKTGDESSLDVSALMVIMSAALILLIIIIERRREKEEEF